MESYSISEVQWDVVQRTLDHAGAIRKNAERLIQNLSTQFNERAPHGVEGVSVSLVGSGAVIGTISSPFGDGRFKFGWARSTDEIVGRVVIERKSFDSRDREIWEPVWTLFVPVDGAPFTGNGEDRRNYRVNSSFPDDSSAASFEVGMRVICALIPMK